ncbi:type I-E CRISPR-associated protein Cse1/CasA [Streptomyces sp. NBC_00249]|uniref:type I-E CRISPR-associated protein Cse1/CasA n=1 Tax=Streptomyces sp. NBC_00249 TaxID=2975690 RepID=UPI00225A866A|nr:type I-E CRISPR-associated protein Cse1/CasA [Streptomyces sp. NBC_00249]MCX5199260.1 type I-E CRISPR-associated protein Cse1/CasA [Streptomyces sp. NBC_00249]
MARPQWDPRRQPCAEALTLKGERVERSLIELLAEADGLRSVSGSTPGEQVALLEYLLAICYASGTSPSTDTEWRDWVEDGHSLDQAARWLADRPEDEIWDLFHPTEPLGQNSLLAPYLDQRGAGPAQVVIEQVGDYSQFFDHHHLDHPQPLSPAEAFRAVLTQHVYGPAGRARISGKETLGPTITNLAVGRLSSRIRVIALGSTLGETLRLNLMPSPGPPGEFNRSWTSGTQARRGFRTKPDGRPVSGPADLHSALGRSVLLRPAVLPGSGDIVVDRVLMGAGELLRLQRPHLQDAVYATTVQGVEKPLWPSASRAFWRDAHALYTAVVDAGTADRGGRGTNLYRRLALFPGPDALRGPDGPPVRSVRLWAVGLVAKQTTAITWISGSFPFAPGLGAVLCHASTRGSAIAEYVAMSLGKAAYAAWEIAYPNPKPSDKAGQVARFDVRWRHWEAAEDPFHILLEETAAREPVHECLFSYASTLTDQAKGFLAKSLDSLPRNSRGFQTRAAALRRFEDELASRKAPAELHGEKA